MKTFSMPVNSGLNPAPSSSKAAMRPVCRTLGPSRRSGAAVSYDTVYAVYQHERLDLRHVNGRKATPANVDGLLKVSPGEKLSVEIVRGSKGMSLGR